jgi:DNA-binding NtrC family response regulator
VNNGALPATPEVADAPPAVRPWSAEGAQYRASEVRILVLDDDETVCNVMQAALAPQEFKVDVVSTSSRIEEALRRQEYHVIILDYVLPGLEPEQVFEWIRETQHEASIIVVTAYPSIDSALNCLRARTYDYLTKPFQVAQFQRTVMRCLESKGL